MCGLAGVLSLSGKSLDQNVESVLRGMGNEIAHRGPDDEQLLREGPLGMIFRRLSIVDLAGGQQPFRNEDGSLILMVNGEIYNHLELRRTLREPHRFATRSDCEIILHLYEELGLGFLDHLVGMYAIALYDRKKQKLILARDRFGIKPLYYSFDESRLLFASEIKALLRHPDCPREFDWSNALSNPLIWGDAPVESGEPRSFFKGIHHLPAGCHVVADLRERTVEQNAYWRLPVSGGLDEPVDKRSDQEIIDGYGALLQDSVKKCLMSDVEYGAFLSGGIDSVALCAFAAEEGTFHSFSVLGQSTFTNRDSRYASLAARMLKLTNHQVLYEWHQTQISPDQWKDLVWLCETPFCGPEQLYKFQLYRYAKAVRPNLKVMLIGQGSDEFNGGYSTLLAGPEGWPGFQKYLEGRERERLLRGGNPFLRYADSFAGEELLTRDFLRSQQRGPASAANAWDQFLAVKYYDLQMYNCWHEDRTAAGNSVENRVPFLDHRLVEYALRVPASRRETFFWDKRILRQALRSRLPEEFCARPKGPFFYGKDVRYTNRMMVQILTREDYGLLEEVFCSAGGRAIFRKEAIDAVIRRIEEDPEAHGIEYLLRLVNMRLLEMRAANLPAGAFSAPVTDIPEALPIGDWDAMEPELALRLTKGAGGEAMDGPGKDEILDFAENVYLVKRDGHGVEEEWYLVVDEKVKYVLTEADVGGWLKVLREIDGERTLEEIMKSVKVTEAEIRKFLDEALDFGVLERYLPDTSATGGE